MNFAHPAALAWAALALPIVALYILKVRQRRVLVSTNLFWRQIFEDERPRSLWEILRHLLSLLVQLALLGLLVLALAEPVFRWEILQAKRYALIIDNSASMNATDGSPTRLDAAKAEAIRVIDALRPRDEMALIVAGVEPAVACGLTGHQRTLREAVEAIRPTDGPTRVAEAVALARRLLGDGRPKDAILVVTDGGFPDAAALIAAEDVDAAIVGKATPNSGITRFQARRSLIDPVGYEILIEVTNASKEKVERRLEIDLDGDLVDVVPLTLEPGGKWSKVIEKTAAGGGRLTAALNGSDALAADDRATAILPRRDPRPVTLATQGDLFLENVLRAIPLVSVSLVKEPPVAALPAGSALVLHRTVPAKLPPGPVFVVDPTGSCDLWDLGEPLQDAIVAGREKDSPLLAHVKLENISMPEARKLTPRGKATPLAWSVGGEPLLCAFDRPEGKVVVLTVNLDRSDLPLQTAFPILMSNALTWFAGGQGELREALPAGATATVDLPSSPTRGTYALTSPDGTTRRLPAGAARATVGPFDRVGVWSVVPEPPAATPGQAAPKAEPRPPVAEFACNLASAAESDLRPPEAAAARLKLSAGLGGRPAWHWLAAAAWLLAGLEWFLYQRRWIS